MFAESTHAYGKKEEMVYMTCVSVYIFAGILAGCNPRMWSKGACLEHVAKFQSVSSGERDRTYMKYSAHIVKSPGTAPVANKNVEIR